MWPTHPSARLMADDVDELPVRESDARLLHRMDWDAESTDADPEWRPVERDPAGKPGRDMFEHDWDHASRQVGSEDDDDGDEVAEDNKMADEDENEADAAKAPASAAPVPLSLMAHQEEAIAFLREHPDRACIALPMGMGKSAVVSTGLVRLLPEQERAVGVAPRTMLPIWKKELRKWGWQRPVFVAYPPLASLQRTVEQWARSEGGVLLLNENSVRTLMQTEAEADRLRSAWVVFVDEAQSMKNGASQFVQAMRKLRPPRCWLLSGTPLMNNLGEYYQLMDYLRPGLLGHSLEEFKARYQAPIEFGLRSGSTDAARKKMRAQCLELFVRARDVLFRRTERDAPMPLRPNVDCVLYIQLSDAQRAMYDYYMASQFDVTKLVQHNGALLRVLLSPFMIDEPAIAPASAAASGGSGDSAASPFHSIRWNAPPRSPRLLTADTMDRVLASSPKLDFLIGLMRGAPEDDRFVVFAEHNASLDWVGRLLQVAFGWRAEREVWRIDGSMSSAARTASIDAINDGRSKARVVLMTNRTGVGVSLIGANRIVLMDQDFNPAVMDQAAERCRRMGQTKQVYIYRLVTWETFEHKKAALAMHKRVQSHMVLDDRDPRRVYDAVRWDDETSSIASSLPPPRTDFVEQGDPALRAAAEDRAWMLGYHFVDDLLRDDPTMRLQQDERAAIEQDARQSSARAVAADENDLCTADDVADARVPPGQRRGRGRGKRGAVASQGVKRPRSAYGDNGDDDGDADDLGAPDEWAELHFPYQQQAAAARAKRQATGSVPGRSSSAWSSRASSRTGVPGSAAPREPDRPIVFRVPVPLSSASTGMSGAESVARAPLRRPAASGLAFFAPVAMPVSAPAPVAARSTRPLTLFPQATLSSASGLFPVAAARPTLARAPTLPTFSNVPFVLSNGARKIAPGSFTLPLFR